MGSTKTAYRFEEKEEQYQGQPTEALRFGRKDAWEAAGCCEAIDQATGRPMDAIAAGWYWDDLNTIAAEMRRRGVDVDGPHGEWVVSGLVRLESGNWSRKHRELSRCLTEEAALADRLGAMGDRWADEPEHKDVLVWTAEAWRRNLAKGRDRR